VRLIIKIQIRLADQNKLIVRIKQYTLFLI